MSARYGLPLSRGRLRAGRPRAPRSVAAAWCAVARHIAPAGYLVPALALYTLFVLWPLARLIGLSLVQWDGYSAPAFVGFANYGALWSDPGFVTELEHSLLWLVITLVVPVVVGLGLALLLVSAPRPLRVGARGLLLIPLLLPTTVLAVAWRLLYNPLSGPLTGLLHAVGLAAPDWLGDPSVALWALLLPACWASFGLSMLVFEATVDTISPEIVEAAAVDGAGAWARFRAVTLPALRSALPLAMLVTALVAVPSFDLVRLLTNGGPGYATTTLLLDMYGRAFGTVPAQVGVGAALACLQMAAGLALAGLALLVAGGGERLTGDGAAADGAAADGAAARRAVLRGRGWHSAGIGGRLTVLIAVTAAVVFPVAWLAVLAARGADGLPGDSSASSLWSNLGAVWSNGFGGAFVTSLIAGAAGAAAVAILAVPAAFALATSRHRALQAGGLILLAVGLFQPSAVLIIPLYQVLTWLGLLNTPLGFVVPQIARTLPLAVLLLWGALRALPRDVLAAAAVGGAPPRRVLWSIALPMVRPMVAVVLLWSFLSAWNDYLLPTIVLQDGTTGTVPLALAQFVGSVDTQYGPMATGALLAIVPLIALYAMLYGAVALGPRRLRMTFGQM